MRKSCKIFIFLQIFLSVAIAQSDFRDGYLINLKGDTLNGQIDYRSKSYKGESIRFRQSTLVNEYLPKQILGFGYTNGTNYKSFGPDNLFAEVLVRGELSLYKYDDFFIMVKDSIIYWLQENKEVQEINGTQFAKEDNKWRGTISYLIYDCLPDAPNILIKMQFNESELVKLTIKYNKCIGTGYLNNKDSKQVFKVDLGVAMGLTNSSIHRSDILHLIEPNALSDSYSSIDPVFGLVLTFSSPRLNEHIAIQTGVHFTHMKYSELVKTIGPDRNYYSFIELSSLSFPLSVRYTVPKGRNSLFAQAGYNLDYLFKKETSLLREDIINGSVYIYPEKDAMEIAKIQQKFLVGAGISRSFKGFNGDLGLYYYPPFKSRKLSATSNYIHSIHNNRINLSIIISRK